MTDVPLALDPDVRVLDRGRVLLGGSPGRLVRLRTGIDLGPLATGQLDGPLRRLAHTLLDGGLVHPRPGPVASRDVTVVVPVRDRARELDRCLQALGNRFPVLVVDDASGDPAAVRRVAARHGARVLRQDVNTGPAGARNAGIAATTGALVALVDSDCVVPPGWLEGLAGHLDDLTVAAVAPRVLSRDGGRSLLARYAAARGPLDMGPVEAQVRPGSRVPYVPTAALLVRRSALAGERAFDPALRFGEDVDLVWRLHDAGWKVRYDPRTVVRHTEPEGWRDWLRRRHDYGTSAAPLAYRHGARVTPLVLPPWPTAAWLLLCARRPLLCLLAAAVPAARLRRHLRRAGLAHRSSAATAAAATAAAVEATGRGLGGAGLTSTAPFLLAGLLTRRTRAAAALLIVAPPLLDHLDRRPAMDPVRWTALRLLDDLSYASGVWQAAWAARSTSALRPRRRLPS